MAAQPPRPGLRRGEPDAIHPVLLARADAERRAVRSSATEFDWVWRTAARPEQRIPHCAGRQRLASGDAEEVRRERDQVALLLQQQPEDIALLPLRRLMLAISFETRKVPRFLAASTLPCQARSPAR